MTIKELADELGVSKQAIRKRITKLDPELVSITTNRPIEISEEGVLQIKTAFNAYNGKCRKKLQLIMMLFKLL